MAGRRAAGRSADARCYNTLTADRQTADADVLARDRGGTVAGQARLLANPHELEGGGADREAVAGYRSGASVALRLHATLLQGLAA
jgi:hypothetical protein